MAKVYKATIYITDYNDDIADLDYLKQKLEDTGLGAWMSVKVAEAKESEEFEWDDELLINKRDAEADDFEAYLKG